MICPVEIARDLSAFPAARVGDHAKHGFLLEGRDGAGHENTGSDFAGTGEEDHLVAGSRDYRHQRSVDATLARATGGVWLRRLVRPAAWPAFPQASPPGNGRAGLGTVPRALFRSERAAFSREAAPTARDWAELHLGKTSSARSRDGQTRPPTGSTSPTPGATAPARHVAAHRRQPAPLVSGRALVRPDRHSG